MLKEIYYKNVILITCVLFHYSCVEKRISDQDKTTVVSDMELIRFMNRKGFKKIEKNDTWYRLRNYSADCVDRKSYDSCMIDNIQNWIVSETEFSDAEVEKLIVQSNQLELIIGVVEMLEGPNISKKDKTDVLRDLFWSD